MTKQGEIREGIKAWLMAVAEDAVKNPTSPYIETALRGILNDLCSQGVVIKVDRELPKRDHNKPRSIYGYEEAQRDKVKAGYVAVEPIIEEV